MDVNLLSSLSYGVYAVGVKGEKGPSACIVNAVIQVTNTNPPIVAISMHHDNYSHSCIREAGIFSVSVLSEDTSGAVIGALGFNSGRDINKLHNVRHRVLTEGVPVIKENACCWFLCKVVGSAETPTHTVFLAEVVAGSEKITGTPMTYTYYHQVLKGTTPKNAPTHRAVPDVASDQDGGRFICTVCGYIYSDPNLPFEELPEDWLCPICAAPKSVFVRK